MNRNSAYIQSLQYDLNALLSVDLRPSSQPAYPDREHKDGRVIVCKKQPHNASASLTENVLLNPSIGVIVPGAILKQDRTLAEGVPTPYTFPRAPLTLRVNLPGLEEKGVITIANPTTVTIETEIEKVVDYWLTKVKDQEGYHPPVRAFSTSHKAYTKEQISVEMGFGAQWGKNSVTMNLKAQSTTEETIVYRAFRQVYYTIHVQEPEEPGAVFAESVELSSTNMPAGQPPGIVRSVDYGRIIIVQMSTYSHVTEQEAEGTLDMVTGGVHISAELKEKYDSIAKNSMFQALVLGGGSESAQLLTGDPGKISQAIIEGIEFSKQNPSYPVAYVVADLKTGGVSVMNSTTNYVETVRQVLDDRAITLKHHGWYAAKFVVTWKEVDDSGHLTPKSWDSGKKTAPWDQTLYFPGDATDFTVTGTNDTWLAWDPHRHVSVRYPVLEGNKTVTIAGTTLNMTISA